MRKIIFQYLKVIVNVEEIGDRIQETGEYNNTIVNRENTSRVVRNTKLNIIFSALMIKMQHIVLINKKSLRGII